MKNKGFTLIELLAVIIILGILMLIAIPSVTNYINNSRKETYVNTVSELIKGASIMVNSGEIEVNDPNTTYYVPVSAIKTENGEARSPYGKFEPAYIAVTYDGETYDYYFIGKDEADMGTDTLIKSDNLNKDSIKSGVDDIPTSIGVDGRENIIVYNPDLSIKETKNSTDYINGNNGEKIVCKRAKSLHSAECNRSDGYGCDAVHNQGDVFTLGNLKSNGSVISAGDAFDCDVNDDGNFDDYEERFYYVSSSTKEDREVATFIYSANYKYNRMSTNFDGIQYSLLSDIQAIDPSVTEADNIHGPVTTIKQLPKITKWKNKLLITEQTRNIVNELGSKTTVDGTIVESFTYTGCAARLLTFQEIEEACGPNSTSTGYFDNCTYFMENTRYFETDSSKGSYYWNTETPKSGEAMRVYHTNSVMRNLNTNDAVVHAVGTRPAIDVYLDNVSH